MSQSVLIKVCICLLFFCGLMAYLYHEEKKGYTALRKDLDDLYKENADFQKQFAEKQKQLEQVERETVERLKRAEKDAYDRIRGEEETSKARIEAQANEMRKAMSELENHKSNLKKLLESNLTAIPWLSGMMSDFLTYDLEITAKKLDWGHNIERAKKVQSIRAIRAEAMRRIEEAKAATYQMEYLRTVFPEIEDFLSTDYRELQLGGKLPEHDPVRDYLSAEEWAKLSEDEKNQLALDRYVASRKKSRWQIGRDYELSVAYEYSQKGYKVDTFGSYMGREDLGRDLIAKKGRLTLIIQCKYWSQSKLIHEKHIFQLYGTVISYCIEKNIPPEYVEGIFVTNIKLSETAKKMADFFSIYYVENHKFSEFPRIKCNIGKDGPHKTKIYHLPMDEQYDVTKIENDGEFYAFTVKEAVDAGFRRAFKWHGGQD